MDAVKWLILFIISTAVVISVAISGISIAVVISATASVIAMIGYGLYDSVIDEYVNKDADRDIDDITKKFYDQ